MNEISVLEITLGGEIYNVILVNTYKDEILCTE